MTSDKDMLRNVARLIKLKRIDRVYALKILAEHNMDGNDLDHELLAWSRTKLSVVYKHYAFNPVIKS